MVFQITYKSKVSLKLSEDDLLDLLAQAIKNNSQMHITGALLQNEAGFIQVLEGKSKDVLALMSKILKDKRHSEVTIVSERLIKERDFDHWSMAYIDFIQLNHADKLELNNLLDNKLDTKSTKDCDRLMNILTKNL